MFQKRLSGYKAMGYIIEDKKEKNNDEQMKLFY